MACDQSGEKKEALKQDVIRPSSRQGCIFVDLYCTYIFILILCFFLFRMCVSGGLGLYYILVFIYN